MFRYLATLSFVLLFSSCSDDASVVFYQKDIKQLPCLRLSVFPPDKELSDTLLSIYNFDDSCEYMLQVSKKGGIVCNSNQNADKKALSNFPTGYIRFDVYKNSTYIYSYYKDLNHKLKKSDIKDGFSRLSKDLLL